MTRIISNDIFPEIVKLLNLDPKQEYRKIDIYLEMDRDVEINCSIFPTEPNKQTNISKEELNYWKGSFSLTHFDCFEGNSDYIDGRIKEEIISSEEIRKDKEERVKKARLVLLNGKVENKLSERMAKECYLRQKLKEINPINSLICVDADLIHKLTDEELDADIKECETKMTNQVNNVLEDQFKDSYSGVFT